MGSAQKKSGGILCAAGLLTAALSFNIAAEGSMEQHLQRHYNRTPERMVRTFEMLCVRDAGENREIYARFRPNEFDYYTKSQPNAPITRAEHVRGLLIQSRDDIAAFIGTVKVHNVTNSFVLAQTREMETALQAFNESPVPLSALPSCDLPFPKP